MAHDPSKTEQATPRRVKKARDKGNVAKSQETPKTISVLAGLVILTVWTGFIGKDLMGIFRFFLSSSASFSVTDAGLSS
ncbi:MAG: EscU/YscU/HrcU family type III secretion system export apparatus switch protein, partial [Desulfovibrio sp.]|nr:EscU/YscU/HrcU family type III secretion system export apparatus switch protein [Desulfovibrio sp.]